MVDLDRPLRSQGTKPLEMADFGQFSNIFYLHGGEKALIFHVLKALGPLNKVSSYQVPIVINGASGGGQLEKFKIHINGQYIYIEHFCYFFFFA